MRVGANPGDKSRCSKVLALGTRSSGGACDYMECGLRTVKAAADARALPLHRFPKLRSWLVSRHNRFRSPKNDVVAEVAPARIRQVALRVEQLDPQRSACGRQEWRGVLEFVLEFYDESRSVFHSPTTDKGAPFEEGTDVCPRFEPPEPRV